MTLAPVILATSRRTGEVRPFVESDIPQVARLHRSVFRPVRRDSAGLDAYHAYFTRVFLDSPSRTAALPSLVYQEDDGRVAGFIGVVPRRMTLNGQLVQAAISTQFVVDPSSRGGLVAVRLAKAFLDGPQDLSISDEAGDTSRRIWEGLGGTTSLLHSLYWTRPLRPAQLVGSWLRRRVRAASLVTPLAALADTIATRMAPARLGSSEPRGSADDFDAKTILEHVPRIAGAGSLHPDYDDRTFQWVIERATQRRASGRLHAAVIRNGETVLGWFIYHMDRDRVADVLQIAATSSSIQDVLEHLLRQAGRQRAVAVTGRLEPRFLQALSDNYCLLHRRGPWMLIHSRRRELIRCFHDETALFSRLDGEWCLGF